MEMSRPTARIERAPFIYHKDSPPWPFPHQWYAWREHKGTLLCSAYTKSGCILRAKSLNHTPRVWLRTNGKAIAKARRRQFVRWLRCVWRARHASPSTT